MSLGRQLAQDRRDGVGEERLRLRVRIVLTNAKGRFGVKRAFFRFRWFMVLLQYEVQRFHSV
jgi:hypothetical protein